MTTQRRNLLIILGAIVVIFGIAIAVYFLFFGPSSAHLTVSTGATFPDTTGKASSNPAAPANQVAGNAGTAIAPNLIEITSSPVSAGEVAFDIGPASAATSTSFSSSTAVTVTTSNPSSSADIEVRYIDRQSGNVYAYRAIARSLTRISDKTLPGIQTASWLSDGSLALVRFLAPDANGSEHLDTYALPSTGGNGFFLSEDLDEAVVTGTNSLLTLTASTDNSIGTLMNSDGSNSSQVFTTPLSSLVVYSAGNTFIAATKPTSELAGYAFSINPSSGLFTPILGPLQGLTVLPNPSGTQVLYSYTDGTNLHMGVLNLSNGSSISLPLATLAEKCVWTSDGSALYCAIPTSLSGNLPDDWYQGATSFTDRIWRIDLSTRLATLALDPHAAGHVNIDAVNLTLDPQNQVLVFRNKKDSSLWAYSL
jgi:hypothetical protein